MELCYRSKRYFTHLYLLYAKRNQRPAPELRVERDTFIIWSMNNDRVGTPTIQLIYQGLSVIGRLTVYHTALVPNRRSP